MTTTTEFMNHGKELMTKFRFAEAEQSFKQALQSDARCADAMVWLGRIALMKEQHDAGKKLIEDALQIEPNNAEAYALLGVRHMQLGEYDQAIEVLEKARSLNPNLEMTYYNLGRAYRVTGRLEDSEKALRKAIEMNPKHFQARAELSYVLGQTDRVKEGILELVESIKINPFFLKGYLVLGELYKRGGKGELVIRLYHEGLRHNPNAIVLREELCNLYALKLDYRSAFHQAREIITRRNYYGDYLRLGTYAIALGEFSMAERAWKKALELNPQSWEAHYNLGELYMTAQLVPEAKEQYKLAVEKGGNNYKPFNGMGLFLLHHEKNAEEAKKYFLRALEISPMQIEPMMNMALACAMLKDWKAAETFAMAVLKVERPGTSIYQEAEKLMKVIQKEQQA